VLLEIQTLLRFTPHEPHGKVYIQYAYASMVASGLTNQANRRDEGRAAGPPRSVRVEREVRQHDH
jgi:hypothetical protein